MSVDWAEHAARAFETPPRQWPTPGALAKHLDPRTVETPALQLIDAALVELLDTPDGRLIITMAPQEGKSTRVTKDFTTWALTQNPNLRIATASYAQSLANRNGRSIRRNITGNPDLGLTIAPDNGSVQEWQLTGHDGGVLSVGLGGGFTGRPADMLVIDDPIKDREQADSEVYRARAWDWWIEVGSARLAPGAPVALILTRWHHEDLAGKLLAAEDGHLWTVMNIPAQADHDPTKGETDPLGRQPGEFMVSARGRTVAQWEAIKTRVGPRTWASLYQGRPTPGEGNMFDRAGWSTYDHDLHIERADGTCHIPGLERENAELIQSWDFTFKDTKNTDYVVGQVWLRRGIDCYLVDQVRARMAFPESCAALRAMTARWPQALLKLVEDKANGPAIISSLQRTVPGIVPVEPDGSKVARAAAITPLVVAKNVHLPAVELRPWVAGLIEEAAAFPTGSHDDQVDALTQALTRLILIPLQAGADLLDEHDVLGDEAHELDYLTAF